MCFRKSFLRHVNSSSVLRQLMCLYCCKRSWTIIIQQWKVVIQVFSTLMRHQVKLDASFLSLVIAVAVVEVLFLLPFNNFPILSLITILRPLVIEPNIFYVACPSQILFTLNVPGSWQKSGQWAGPGGPGNALCHDSWIQKQFVAELQTRLHTEVNIRNTFR